MSRNKPLQFCQTQLRLNSGMTTCFYKKYIIIKPLLQNFIVMYDAVQIVFVMWIPYDLHSLYKPL
jgi:hypothetical protein